ncbi:hypothetical protein GCM10009687_51580 [Asanoa iriomotensis]|uniref:DUF11 domain-containing protein n=1 Tax=Asanoa iriomotensis TaxID=234613 RepID=A0ABQ4BWR7_9ACTN|nr:hypothetical protein Air01nite_10750 [Asanoa iriomotensis]
MPLGLLVLLSGVALATPLPSTVDVALAGKVAPATVRAGQDATLTITAHNKGFLPAAGVRVAVPLPSRLAVTKHTAGQGSFDGLVWTVGALPVRKTVTLTLVVRGSGPATVTAAAALVGATPRDGDARNDLATAALRVTAANGAATVPRADLALVAQVVPATARLGEPVSFVVTVTNKGPAPASDVEVADPVVAGTFLASAATAGQVTGLPVGTGAVATAARWHVGTLAAGASATWTVRALTAFPVWGDTAVLVTQSGADDPVPGNAVARAAPVVTAADVALERDVSNLTPVFGQEITITLTVGNAGPDPARAVTVTDPPRDGLVFVSASSSAGGYDQEAGRWAVGDLTPGAEATLTVRVRVEAAGPIAGRAVAEASPGDPDSANNAAETVLTASGAEPLPLPVFRTGFPLPFTEIRLSTMEATIVGGLLMAFGLVLLAHVAPDVVRTRRAGGVWPATSPGRRSRRPGRERHAAPDRSR